MMWHDALLKQLIKVKAGGSREEKNDVWQIVSAQGVEDDPGGPVLGVTSRNLSTHLFTTTVLLYQLYQQI